MERSRSASEDLVKKFAAGPINILELYPVSEDIIKRFIDGAYFFKVIVERA